MWKMKKILICLFVALAASMQAKSMRELLVTMPDSIVPYLSKSHRIELVDLLDMKVKPEVKNLLDGSSKIDTLATGYLSLSLSEAATIELKLLPLEGGDSLLCMVKTLAGPERESEVSFYSQQWEPMRRQGMFGGKSLPEMSESLIVRPDTMDEQRFRELRAMIEPRLVCARLSLGDNSISLSLSLPLVAEEEKADIKAILVQRNFNWDGERFNVY